MKFSPAIVLAAFLVLGAISTAFAQDAYGGINSSNSGASQYQSRSTR